VLVGSMGAGKSTVGRALATRLGTTFLDNDEYLEGHSGRTAAEIATADGADALHRAEAAGLLAALTGDPTRVVAAAGSVVDDEAVRARLARDDVTVVWLRAHPSTLRRRALSGTHRPFVHGDPSNLTRIDTARRPHYEQVADLVVDVDGHSPAEIVDEIAPLVVGSGAG
jgi:shikimate kinase